MGYFRPLMPRPITIAEVQAALDDFVQAGLVCAFSPSEVANRRKGFGKGQRALIKTVLEEFCPCFVPGGTVVYIGDAEDKFLHLDADYLQRLGVVIPAPAKMPDVVIHDTKQN